MPSESFARPTAIHTAEGSVLVSAQAMPRAVEWDAQAHALLLPQRHGLRQALGGDDSPFQQYLCNAHGYGSMIGQSVGARHSHLDNAGYSLDQSMEDLDKKKLVEALIAEEIDRCMLTSLHICLLARKILGDKELITEALASIGIKTSPKELTEKGETIWRLKNKLKRDMGFDFKKLSFPKRFFETPSTNGKLDEKTAREIIDLYIKEAKF